MTHAGHARNFEWVLRRLGDRGHEVHIAVERADKHGVPRNTELLESLIRTFPRFSTGMTPEARRRSFAAVSQTLRAGLNYLRSLEPPLAHSPKVRQRAAQPVPPLFDRLLSRSRMRPVRRVLHGLLLAAYRAVPVAADDQEFVAKHRPDAVVVTPLLEGGSRQPELARTAMSAGIPVAAAVASWDNLTTKGRIHEPPTVIAAWNDAQRQELSELDGVPTDRVAMTGAPPYDHWFHWRPTATREEHCHRIGLDPERPYVLYVGSSAFIAPREAEAAAEWIRQIREVGDGEIRRLQFLVRPHPLNPLPEESASLMRLPGVAVEPPKGANPIDERTRSEYFDAIFHSAAVLGVNTSALVEAAIVGRPVHALLDPRYGDTQTRMLHFRHLLPETGGMLVVANSPKELASNLAASLSDPHGCDERNRAFVKRFVRPLGLRTDASERLVDLIEELPSETLDSPK